MGRFYFFILILSLLFLHPVFCGKASAEDVGWTLTSFTTGTDIHVRDYDIDTNKKWNLEASFSFPAFGRVGVTTLTAPKNGKFNLSYTFVNSNNLPEVGLATFDFDNLQLLSHKRLTLDVSNFNIYTYPLSSNPNKTRFGFYQNQDLFSSKIKSSGKPAKTKSEVIDNNPNLLLFDGGFSWDGRVATQVGFDPAVGNVIDIQSLNGAGKRIGSPQRFGLGGDEIQTSASPDFGGKYFIAGREFRRQGNKDQTSINIADVETGTNRPLGGFEILQGFKTTKFRDFMFFGSVHVYEDFFLYSKDKNNKLTLNVGLYDRFTGKHLGKDQTLVGPSDPALQNSSAVYGIFAVGGDYTADRSSKRK